MPKPFKLSERTEELTKVMGALHLGIQTLVCDVDHGLRELREISNNNPDLMRQTD